MQLKENPIWNFTGLADHYNFLIQTLNKKHAHAQMLETFAYALVLKISYYSCAQRYLTM